MLKRLSDCLSVLLGTVITVFTVMFSIDTYNKYAHNPYERAKLKQKIRDINPFKNRG